ncbi:hypothetical protein [Geoglobus sp.]
MNVRHLGINVERYMKFILLPSLVGALVLFLVIYFFLYPVLEFLGMFRVLLLLVPLFLLLPAILYIKMVEVRMKNEIDSNIHFYITHMGALSTSEIDRKELMKILSERKEYKALAE